MKAKTKSCIICGEEQELSAYYKHKAMGDGYLNKCKTCCKKQSKEREELLRKDPEWVEKEKKRSREKYHRLGYREKHKPTPEQKKKAINNYKSKYPEKYIAKSRSSRLKPKTIGNQLHHWSYNEEHYLDVIELNVKDHNIIHRHMVYDQERMMYRVAIKFGLWEVGTLLDTRERSESFYKEILFN